jgi:hypothetical protein
MPVRQTENCGSTCRLPNEHVLAIHPAAETGRPPASSCAWCDFRVVHLFRCGSEEERYSGNTSKQFDHASEEYIPAVTGTCPLLPCMSERTCSRHQQQAQTPKSSCRRPLQTARATLYTVNCSTAYATYMQKAPRQNYPSCSGLLPTTAPRV